MKKTGFTCTLLLVSLLNMVDAAVDLTKAKQETKTTATVPVSPHSTT